MAKLGIAISPTAVTTVLVEGTRPKFTSTIPGSGSPEQGLKEALTNFKSRNPKIGRKLRSVAVATNAVRKAIEENRNLGPVNLIRLSAPEGRDSPPLLEAGVRKSVLRTFTVVAGGYGFDGRVIAQPDEREIDAAYNRSDPSGAYVVSSPFSILFPQHEQVAKARLSIRGAKEILCSHEISYQPSTLDRETTGILSAATSQVISNLEETARSILGDIGAKPTIYFARNNGSVVGAELAKRFPLDTAWGFEAQLAAGASKLERKPNCAVAWSENGRTYVAGTKAGKPLTAKISYLSGMLTHVERPLIAQLSNEADVILNIAGVKKAYRFGEITASNSTLHPKKTRMAELYPALHAAVAEINWSWSLNIPLNTNQKAAERSLKSEVNEAMKKAAAKKVRFTKIASRPGMNLPEGTVTLTLSATGKQA